MEKIAILIKSYHNDVHRVVRLLNSIQHYNRDKIAVYVCVSKKDSELFREKLVAHSYKLVLDEDVLELTMKNSPVKIPAMDGYMLQQVVKSEFWRLGLCENFLIIDSDSYFIKDFYISDFIWKDNIPYTIMNEGRHQREWAARGGNLKFLRQYKELRDRGKMLFGRQGPYFDFAPTPMVCSCMVWQALYEKIAQPKGISFYDQILEFPCETQWYGEFLLHDQTIPIIPREPLFKCWGFKGQWEEGMKLGESDEVLAENYLGVVEQSNWNKELDGMSVAEKKKLRWQKRWKRWTKWLS